jgi:hypothetical protein
MRRLLNPLALAACVWLGAAATAAAQADFEWNGQLAPGQRIEVIGVNGSIHAAPSSGGNVIVTAVKTAGRRGNPADVRVEMVTNSNGVTVCVVYPGGDGCRQDGGGQNTRDNDTRVDFNVQVPAGVNLQARSVNGSIDAQGLQSDTEATTVNGSVTLSTAGTARATTVNGSINAAMGQAIWRNGGRFTTVNGQVTLRLPSAVNADVRLSTVSGQIQSDFPLQMSNDPGPKHAEGVLGGGGQRLDVTTVNGAINLLRN